MKYLQGTEEELQSVEQLLIDCLIHDIDANCIHYSEIANGEIGIMDEHVHYLSDEIQSRLTETSINYVEANQEI